ncbi:TIGR04283 family arsenosugar biosynthesis glycosyltransferase [Flavobacteriaceae bacterium S0825]|uniref:TIGR04283 family arsenosugar biosynthesis glycosyltransferase n=1 Tax=Gaetbulibacter sp. S0825 TaxID=2720084 RepID=UPI0014310AD1|nr:TIGR04283 family arsenosugar biosynthesis glycosyltransferase [Gaetbulibacter sp. S0825]MCK0107774.1 TIGR04283 family arsenosugar biosynthesis glycosyltransferase [Flavobacteriaceae bacterium S0825]NIX63410.1 glycosyltransferase family 2 protein [Gaetbulibacter sp. S0825]
MTKISIIIPILNEAETIEKLLNRLIENSSKQNIAEIIVVDGGSTDASKDIVLSFVTSSNSVQSEEFYREVNQKGLDTFPQSENTRPDILLRSSEKGRAKQMNTGSNFATGNIIYFLHADSFPPKHFDEYIINEVEKGNPAGCFRLQFDQNHWWLRLASWLTQFHWRACRGGDQSQFITKELFDDIGGFDESYIIYEDNILINELYKRKQFKVINKKLITSARRYEKYGIWKLQYHFWAIYVKKWFGASAEELYSYYKKHIA